MAASKAPAASRTRGPQAGDVPGPLASLLDALPAFVYQRRFDARHTVCYASAGCHALTGYSPAALVDNHTVAFVDLVHPDDRASLASAMTQAIDSGSAYCCAYRLGEPGGPYRWVIDSGGAVSSAPDALLAGVIVASPGPSAMPATGREQAVTSAIAAERRRLARELHDTVTQSLYSVLLFADSGLRLAQSAERDELARTFSQIEGVSRQGLREIRLLLHRLRPNSLATAGLAGALAERLAAVEGSLGIHYRLLASGDLALDEPAEEALYFVALEALNNALKHSRASAVTVRLRAVPGAGGAVLWVSDDGCGFDAAAAFAGCGFGLKTMCERIAAAGGTMRIDSTPGAGTRVVARLPARRAR